MTRVTIVSDVIKDATRNTFFLEEVKDQKTWIIRSEQDAIPMQINELHNAKRESSVEFLGVVHSTGMVYFTIFPFVSGNV